MARAALRLAAWLAIVGLSWAQTAPPSPEALECASRFSLRASDVERVLQRHNNCTLDCMSKQGVILSWFQPEGRACHQAGWHCALGKCLEGARAPPAGWLDVEVRVLRARVPQRDPNPGQGYSDVFVVIELLGAPKTPPQLLCYTHTVQDTVEPSWPQFACRPQPLAASSLLRFRLLDADELAAPDPLGSAVASVEQLAAAGRHRLALRPPPGSPPDARHWLEVELSGRPRQQWSD